MFSIRPAGREEEELYKSNITKKPEYVSNQAKILFVGPLVTIYIYFFLS